MPTGEWRQNTNCYCYALNAFKQGYCVPSKLLDTDVVVTCDLVREAVVADGARLVTRDEAMGGQPSSGHYIAMLVGHARTVKECVLLEVQTHNMWLLATPTVCSAQRHFSHTRTVLEA